MVCDEWWPIFFATYWSQWNCYILCEWLSLHMLYSNINIIIHEKGDKKRLSRSHSSNPIDFSNYLPIINNHLKTVHYPIIRKKQETENV